MVLGWTSTPTEGFQGRLRGPVLRSPTLARRSPVNTHGVLAHAQLAIFALTRQKMGNHFS